MQNHSTYGPSVQCPRCGQIVPPNQTCMWCGALLPPQPVPGPQPQQPGPYPQQSPVNPAPMQQPGYNGYYQPYRTVMPPPGYPRKKANTGVIVAVVLSVFLFLLGLFTSLIMRDMARSSQNYLDNRDSNDSFTSPFDEDDRYSGSNFAQNIQDFKGVNVDDVDFYVKSYRIVEDDDSWYVIYTLSITNWNERIYNVGPDIFSAQANGTALEITDTLDEEYALKTLKNTALVSGEICTRNLVFRLPSGDADLKLYAEGSASEEPVEIHGVLVKQE